MSFSAKHRIVIIPATIIALLLIFILTDFIFPLPGFDHGYSRVVYSSDGEVMHCFLSSDEKWRIRAEYEEISGDLCDAVIFKEDKYFYRHPGINPISVVRALWNNLVSGKRTSGASTITMQLARLMDPAPRTLGSKLREAFRALQIEWHYSKKEILTLYLNHLPYGGNIEGVKTAAMVWFGEQPRELSPAQLVTLTVIPNNPNALMPSKRNALLENRNRWIIRMGNKGIFTKEETEDALHEGFANHKNPLPRKSPHISYRLSGSGQSGVDRIQSTIDLRIQSIVETALSNYIRPLRNMQITNAAVIVVDNKTMEVKAYAGSAGFYEERYSGQVDGVRAVRSPGSTLKPALYMLAFDRGIISPKSCITDVPVNFGGYRPENFDETYKGKVTVEEALALSLNVPAVNLLDQIGLNDFTTLLSVAHFDWINKNRKKTGLSLILGGCGTTLEELTGLYAAIANKGIWQPLRYIKEDKGYSPGKGKGTQKRKHSEPEGTDTVRISSPGSAYMITDILTDLKRPDLPNEYLESAGLPKIAWKTGTSYGRRDGWAVGYNADYTIGIWTGNFDGKGIPELNGTDIAVPLLFMIFNQLRKGGNEWFYPPEEVDFRLVCSESGMVPDTFCHNRVMEAFLPGISPSMRCNHLKPVFTDGAGNISYCSECLPEKGYKKVLYPNYPPELISYYEEMSIPYSHIPGHNPRCTYVSQESGPKITSLTDGAEYLVFAGRKQKLLLQSSCLNGTKAVYWYVNRKLLKKAGPSESVYLEASAGNHNITCV
ncbi:MAG TPA: penicillin-binding protein 1C, partial [Bacteroidales bacterium]|nr:penicillin-binding protein 1C [Bacteroidales bacterium]